MVKTYTPAPSPAGIDPKHMVNWQHYNGIIWHPKLDWLNLWTFSGHWRCFRCVRFFLLNKYIQIPLGGHLNPFEQCTQVKLDHFPWDRGEHQKKQLWKPLPERHFFNLHKIPLNCFGPKNPKKRMGEKRPTWLKSFDIDLGQFLLLLGVPGISGMQWSGVKKYSEPKFHALWGGKIPESCLHICIVIPSRWRANLRIPDDSAMFVFFNVGIFSCLFVGHEGIRDFLWSWPRLVPLHWGVLLLRCLLHPGKWTAGTQQRRFGSNDVPFKFRDFNALVVDPTHLKHMLVKLDRLPR